MTPKPPTPSAPKKTAHVIRATSSMAQTFVHHFLFISSPLTALANSERGCRSHQSLLAPSSTHAWGVCHPRGSEFHVPKQSLDSTARWRTVTSQSPCFAACCRHETERTDAELFVTV